MREIKIKLVCNKKTCGNCWYVHYAPPFIECLIFCEVLGRVDMGNKIHFRRCKECFAAEKEANNA